MGAGTLIPVLGKLGEPQNGGHSGIMQFAVRFQQILLSLFPFIDGKLNMGAEYQKQA